MSTVVRVCFDWVKKDTGRKKQIKEIVLCGVVSGRGSQAESAMKCICALFFACGVAMEG